MRIVILIALVLALVSCQRPLRTAHAADMRVSDTRLDVAGCQVEPHPCHVIYIKGRIEVGDGEKFLELLKSYGTDGAVVDLDSPGGSVWDGAYIGWTIANKKLATRVAAGSECTSNRLRDRPLETSDRGRWRTGRSE
jgi:hypothetical protein